MRTRFAEEEAEVEDRIVHSVESGKVRGSCSDAIDV